MDALSILGVALGVGVVVYALSLRTPDAPLRPDGTAPSSEPTRSPLARLRSRLAGPTGEELGFADQPMPAGEAPPESFVYVPVLASRGSGWRTRLGGVLGLLAMVAIGAVAIAIGAYQVGAMLNRMIEGLFGP